MIGFGTCTCTSEQEFFFPLFLANGITGVRI